MGTDLLDTIQESLMGLLGLGLSFTPLYIIYKAIQLKHREKIALIEKGMDPSLADPEPKSKQNNYKNGAILIGISAGIVTGYILNRFFNIPNFVAYSSSILIFCGFLLIFFHKKDIAR